MAGNFKYILNTVFRMTRHQVILYNKVFGSIAQGHGDVKQLVSKPTDELLSQVGIQKSGMFQHLAIEMMAVKTAYSKLVIRLGVMDPSLPRYRKATMLSCDPPHSRIERDSGLKTVTCRQPVWCPSCRMRTQESILARMLPRISEVKYIAVLRPYIRPAGAHRVPGLIDTLDLGKMLRKIFRRRWDKWPYGCVIPLPRYVAKDDEWVAAATIIALVNDKKHLFDPKAKLGRGFEWVIHTASPDRLAHVIAETTSYEARMLYTDEFTNKELVTLRQAYAGLKGGRPPLQLQYQGLPMPKKAMQPITVLNDNALEETLHDHTESKTEYNKRDIIWGPTYAPADVEQPARHQGRLVGLVQSSDRTVPND